MKRASREVNELRVGWGLAPIEIECLLIFNDANREAINLLEIHATPLLANISES